MKTFPKLLFLLLMLAPLAGHASPDITVINAKTGQRSSPPCYSLRQTIADINMESRQFGTLRRTDYLFKQNILIYTIYDQSGRKIKEQKLPSLYLRRGGGSQPHAVRGGKMAYIKEKDFAPNTPGEVIRAQRTPNPPLHVYDMATKIDKVIVPNVMLSGYPSDVSLRWISDTKILIFDQGSSYDADGKYVNPTPNGKLFIIDTISGGQKTISNIVNSHWPNAELSPDFTMLALSEETKRTTTIDKVIKIIKVDSGEIIKTIGKGFSTIGGGPSKSLRWTWNPDSKELAYLEGNQLKVHNITSGRERILTTLSDDYLCYDLLFGKDIIGYVVGLKEKIVAGKRLSYPSGRTLYIIDARTGRPMREIKAQFTGSIRLLDNDCTFVCETGY